MPKETKQIANQIATATVEKSSIQVYSAPVSKTIKEYLINESKRTGLTQKELLSRAVEALKAKPAIASAMPVKL